jgi:hypothetical protein
METQATLIIAEADAVSQSCDAVLTCGSQSWNATEVFNCARKATRMVRQLNQLGQLTPLAARLLLQRASLMSRLARIQRSEGSTAAYLNQCRENFMLLEQRGITGENFVRDGISVAASLDYAAFTEVNASFNNDPRACQKGIVALQVRNEWLPPLRDGTALGAAAWIVYYRVDTVSAGT